MARLVKVLHQELGLPQDRPLPDNLMELFKKRLEEQEKAHQGGNKWIGTGGTSPLVIVAKRLAALESVAV